jgi:hypothetical protein
LARVLPGLFDGGDRVLCWFGHGSVLLFPFAEFETVLLLAGMKLG